MKLGVVFQPSFVPSLEQHPEQQLVELVDDAVLAEALGFHAVWVTEHHFQPFGGLLSAPVVFLAAVSQRTSTIRLGASVAVLPLHNPLHLAEAWATLDVLSGGRVEFGVGRGFSRWEYEAFGVAQAQDRAIRAEALAVLLEAWRSGQVTFQGEHFAYAGVDVLPRPLQCPNPPIWVAAGSGETVDWAAEHGFHLMLPLGSPSAPDPDDLRRLVERYRAGLAKHGHDPEAHDIYAQVRAYVADSDMQARTEAEPYVHRHLGIAQAGQGGGQPDGRPSMPDPGAMTRASMPPRLTWEAQVERGAVIAGSPSMCIAAAQAVTKRIGLTYLALNFSFGGMPTDLRRRSMERFAQEVAPYLT